MEFENNLIEKSFYETLLNESEKQNPIKSLGELFYRKQKDEPDQLDEVRFAQGEVYFHVRDYESAIHKWENVQGNYEQFARKNIADAYLELDLLDTAEEIYQSITTDSLVLNIEIALQLFGLYIMQNKTHEAKQMIQNAVILNPAYPNVTKLARAFFEEIKDMPNAVELAVNEGIRTEDEDWIKVLHGYVEKGHIIYEPTYFLPLLKTTLTINKEQFEKLVTGLWNGYKNKDSFLTWLELVSELLNKEGEPQMNKWETLDAYFEKTYFELVSGQYSYFEIETLMPIYIEAWIKISKQLGNIFSISAAIAWNDLFPGNISQDTTELIGNTIVERNGMSEILSFSRSLFSNIKKWAEDHELFIEREENENQSYSAVLVNVKATIQLLMEQLEKLKEEMTLSIENDEDIVSRLQGSINQLQDLEEEKAQEIREAFLSIKENINSNLRKAIPSLIKESAKIIKEDSDFRNIHLDLNNEMNKRINSYMHTTILPIFIQLLADWIENSQAKLLEMQAQLFEWSSGFNELLGQDRIKLECDFQILEDWKRDADRMTSGIQIEKENIMLKRTPSQVFLKGAGKLLGTFSKNQSVLANAYRSFIQNENYEEVAEAVSSKFLQQYGLFEKAIGRDIHLFIKQPLNTLQEIVEEIQGRIDENQDKLTKFQKNPDLYRNALKIFEVRLRQLEWIQDSKENKELPINNPSGGGQ
ncbi:tetratricopeptide repeat protein [Bacillus niameyensis]|uniref:tetratricopeptide repeat protein n=1 Tax=Bacillus niameyensis TaxID=1522308 RepID=UPI00078357DA|nr:hypothetical protein [Bacillus niameyensis]